MMNAKFETTYMGVSITLKFNAGFGINGTKVGQLITSNQFVQDAIENDPRFGSMFTLSRVYDNQTEEPVDEYELKQVTATKKKTKTNAQIFAENQAKLAKKKSQEAKDTAKGKEPEKIDTVTSLNDAVSFFAEKGDLLKSADQLKELCDKHAVVFPNLKL